MAERTVTWVNAEKGSGYRELTQGHEVSVAFEQGPKALQPTSA